jgi:cobalamin biosynthesis protein CobC
LSAVYHGGDLSKAAAQFGVPSDGWIDLSTGINPQPWPVDAGMLEGLHQLPDAARLDRLLVSAATAHGVDNTERIAAAPGTQALIQWLPRLRPIGRVGIVSPTYGEHAAAWALAGHDVSEIGCLPDAADFDVVVVTRPNNPDGRADSRGDLAVLAASLVRKEGLLVVDEAFADLDPAASVAAQSDGGMIALRSFGKFYGLPGLRLGFAVTDADTARAIGGALGPWPVSSLAADVGAVALADTDWQAATRNWLAQASARLDAMLTSAGIGIVGGTDLYRLAETDAASELHEKLGRAGIYTRPFPDQARWLRFGLPGPDTHWNRLEQAIGS